MHLISLLMHAKFEGNPITCLRFMAFFASVRKEEKERKLATFEGLYFRDGWHDLLQIWYVSSPDMLAPAQ